MENGKLSIRSFNETRYREDVKHIMALDALASAEIANNEDLLQREVDDLIHSSWDKLLGAELETESDAEAGIYDERREHMEWLQMQGLTEGEISEKMKGYKTEVESAQESVDAVEAIPDYVDDIMSKAGALTLLEATYHNEIMKLEGKLSNLDLYQ